MTHTSDLPTVVLKPKEEGRLKAGHLWAFSNEIATAPPKSAPGALADLVQSSSGFVGRGFYHPNSLIAFRVLSSEKVEIDQHFFENRISDAIRWREECYPGLKAYRLIFGESDRMPGLLADRYGDYIVIQAIAAGMERFREAIVHAFATVLSPKGILWRTDSSLREMEGLTQGAPVILSGKIPPRVQIDTENGSFWVDLVGGQKTGFYFDQRDNREMLGRYCKGKRVLDAFCYSGGFGISAARAGAKEVVFVDSARAALELAQANAELNHLESRTTCVEGDALALLAHENPGGPFDVISIDPPAYARSKKHLPVALKAYEKLNSLAMTALPKGGILASSSCSHHVSRETFVEMLRRSARKAERRVRLLDLRSQAKDHPVLLAMPETEYLKFAILQIL